MKNTHAMDSLGDLYRLGLGTTKNYDIAREWHEKAAEADNEFSMYNLGLMYYEGLGVRKDNDTAMKYFLDAERGGHKEALAYIKKIQQEEDASQQQEQHDPRPSNMANYPPSMDSNQRYYQDNNNGSTPSPQYQYQKPSTNTPTNVGPPPELPKRPSNYSPAPSPSPALAPAPAPAPVVLEKKESDERDLRLEQAEKAAKAAEEKMALLMKQLQIQNAQMMALTETVKNFQIASEAAAAAKPVASTDESQEKPKKTEPVKFFAL